LKESAPAGDEALLDAAKGIRRVNGNESLYRRLLNDYMRTSPASAEALEKTMAVRDVVEAAPSGAYDQGGRRQPVAGSSSTVAEQLERCLRSEDWEHANQEFAAYRKTLDDTARAIEAFGKSAQDQKTSVRIPAFSELSMAEFMEKLEELDQMLSSGSAGALRLTENLREGYSGVFRPISADALFQQ
jgi:alkanesulfonate monooxygenase SsuD/methylene tetrahydromethanopterin reductase-like flavin-dependent oxidoreductase (luciferase family)